MAKLIKIGNVYYSDLRIACSGTDCPTPDKPKPHFHRRRKALSNDKRYAEEKLGTMVKLRNAAKHGDSLRGISWDGFKERYMAYAATKNKRTYSLDRLAFRKLDAAIPLATLDSLTPERLEAFKTELQKSTLKVTTKNRMLRGIKTALNKAIDWKMIDADQSFKRVKYSKEPKGKLHFWRTEEVTKLLKHCNGVWKIIGMIGYYAGLRREEIHTLRTSSVDFERNRIHIEPTEDFTPKDYERRFIPMHHKLRSFLKTSLNGSPYVLGDNRPTLGSMTKCFKDCVKDAELTGSLHTLRHTFGSQLAMASVPLFTISKMMGHASLRTTEIYAHLLPEHIEQEIKRLPNV